jgi:7-carboxy-7-deazaguanine synthase
MEQKTFPVSEIFYSIDGEGARTGAPTIFIRLFGCNLDCTYCDSKYACKADSSDCDNSSSFDTMGIDKILYHIERFEPCKCITLTGGEPLINKHVGELIFELRKRGYWVNIETNGSIDLGKVIDSQPESKKGPMDYFFTMDWKSISSGESDKMLTSNLELLETTDVLKFVVGSQEDLDQMKHVLEDNPEIDAQIYVSPVWGKIDPADIVAYLLENKLVYVKVQLQLHKLIWDSDKRGV